jgi:MraZ protein
LNGSSAHCHLQTKMHEPSPGSFIAGATACELDKQGRILVPATLREYAGLAKDVVLTGNLDRIEVWSKEKWAENSNYDDMDSIAEGLTELGIDL